LNGFSENESNRLFNADLLPALAVAIQTVLRPIKQIKCFKVELASCQFWPPNCHWFENNNE